MSWPPVKSEDPRQQMVVGGETSRSRRPNLSNVVAAYVRDQIFSGTLRPGQKIDQDAIAQQLEISRLPVREALIGLEAEGLVENIPRRGAFVARLEPGDIHDHYEMFGLLAGLAARRATVTVDDEAVQRLRTSVADLRSAHEAHEQDMINYSFHREINRAGNSRRLTAVLRILSVSMPTRFFEINRSWERHAPDEHGRIVDALEQRDGDGAAEAMEVHFRNIGDHAVEVLKELDFWSGR